MYQIIKDFKGSQDGSTTDAFYAGTLRELSDSLAAVVVAQGWAKLPEPDTKKKPK